MGRRERRRDGKPPKQLNPLKTTHSNCLDNLGPNWVTDYYDDTTKPFVIDIGCGEGEWLIEASIHYPDYNYLGLELRYDALVIAASHVSGEVFINYQRPGSSPEGLARGNLGFLHANLLSGDLNVVLNDLRKIGCTLQVVAVQFPDPHWKGKHRKRKFLTSSFMMNVASHLSEKGFFYLQSDVFDVARDVQELLRCKGSSFDDSTHMSPLDIEFFGCCVSEDKNEVESTLKKLPPSFLNCETERCCYVKRSGKTIYHLVCSITALTVVKNAAMRELLRRQIPQM